MSGGAGRLGAVGWFGAVGWLGAVGWRRRVRRGLAAVACGAIAVLASGCAGIGVAAPVAAVGPAAELTLGYQPNVTHATPLVGVQEGFYARELGGTELATQVFPAGPAAVEALLSGSLDAAYLGPGPALNAFVRSHGQAIRIVAGAAIGGAALVVADEIDSVAELAGARLASPQLGGTQDVALRTWLEAQGFETSLTDGGEVTIVPMESATAFTLLRTGEIDGAWVPQPWVSWMVLQGDTHVLVPERTLWPAGRFVTTNLVVRTRFLAAHPGTVRALLAGHVAANAWIRDHPERARTAADAALTELTGQPLPSAVLDRAFAAVTFTNDPVGSSLRVSARHAHTVGLLPESELHGIYDLRPLNAVLAARGRPAIATSGLGQG